MRRSTRTFGPFTIFIILVIGIVFGGLISYLTKDVGALQWLSIGYNLGLTQPLVLDLYILKLTFGIGANINVAVIIGIALAGVVCRFIF